MVFEQEYEDTMPKAAQSPTCKTLSPVVDCTKVDGPITNNLLLSTNQMRDANIPRLARQISSSMISVSLRIISTVQI